MAAQYTNVSELLGKQVSFTFDILIELTSQISVTYSKKISGIVTQVLLDLDQSIQISLENGDFYRISEVKDFSVKS